MSLASSTLFAERNSLVTVGPDPPTPVFAVLGFTVMTLPAHVLPGAVKLEMTRSDRAQVPEALSRYLPLPSRLPSTTWRAYKPSASIMQVRLPEANEPQMSAGAPLG